MQVNSTQDWLTKQKRRIVARTYHTVPPPQSRKYNYVFLSAMANRATQRERFIIPPNPGIANPTAASFSNECCLSNGNSSAPGVFAVVNNHGIVRFNVIPPISVTATRR
jgi:hypothetical protein